MSSFTSDGKVKSIYVNYSGNKKEVISAFANYNNEVVKIYSKGGSTGGNNIYYILFRSMNYSYSYNNVLTRRFAKIELCSDNITKIEVADSYGSITNPANQIKIARNDNTGAIDDCNFYIRGLERGGSSYTDLVTKPLILNSGESSNTLDIESSDFSGINFNTYNDTIQISLENSSATGYNAEINNVLLKVTLKSNDPVLKFRTLFRGENPKVDGTPKYSQLIAWIYNESDAFVIEGLDGNTNSVLINTQDFYASYKGTISASAFNIQNGSLVYLNNSNVGLGGQSTYFNSTPMSFNHSDVGNAQILTVSSDANAPNSTTSVFGGEVTQKIKITPQ